jgi:hypothetical protein
VVAERVIFASAGLQAGIGRGWYYLFTFAVINGLAEFAPRRCSDWSFILHAGVEAACEC